MTSCCAATVAVNPMLLPGIFSLADWYLVNYNIFSARGLYEHALSVADETLAANDPDRLRALRGVVGNLSKRTFPALPEGEKVQLQSAGRLPLRHHARDQ